MTDKLPLLKILRRWLPLVIVLAMVVLSGWQVTSSLLQTVDQELSQDRITAQEERLNQQLYTFFEERQTATEEPVLTSPPTRDPFGA